MKTFSFGAYGIGMLSSSSGVASTREGEARWSKPSGDARKVASGPGDSGSVDTRGDSEMGGATGRCSGVGAALADSDASGTTQLEPDCALGTKEAAAATSVDCFGTSDVLWPCRRDRYRAPLAAAIEFASEEPAGDMRLLRPIASLAAAAAAPLVRDCGVAPGEADRPRPVGRSRRDEC